MLLRLAWLGTYVQTAHDDHEDVVGRGEIDLVHDQELVVTEARLSVDVGLPRGFGASLVLPMRLVSTSIRYLDTAGDEVELTTPGIHHRNEVVSGLADPMLLGSYGRAVGAWRVSGRVGMTLPIGQIEEDPFVLGEMDAAHQHIQMGTGTVNPVVAAELGRSWGLWRFGGFAFTQQSMYRNREGYQAGDRYAGGVSVRRRVGAAWSVRGGVEMQAETAERWDGEVHTDDGNRGRVDAMVMAGGAWAATRNLTVEMALKVPVVTHVVGGQLDMPAIVEIGVAWGFGGAAAKTEDDHDHGDEHDHGHDDDHDDHDDHDDGHGEVESDSGALAEALGLEPVIGKITMFDLWADWCAPCKELEPVLIAMARDNPEIELRKIDVSERDDLPMLPHVKIYDATGTLVFEQSSDGHLDELIEAIKAAIARLTSSAS